MGLHKVEAQVIFGGSGNSYSCRIAEASTIVKAARSAPRKQAQRLGAPGMGARVGVKALCGAYWRQLHRATGEMPGVLEFR